MGACYNQGCDGRGAARTEWVRRRFLSRWGSALLLPLLPLACWLPLANAQSAAGEIDREYDLKAVFLYNFTRYVRWPVECLGQPTQPFVIGVLGADPFGGTLDRIAAAKKVDEHPIQVRRFKSPSEYRQCHILFVAGPVDADRQSAIAAAVQDSPVLLVGESKDYCRQGGAINFVIKDNAVKLQLNLVAAKAHSLTLHSGLIKLASEVTEK